MSHLSVRWLAVIAACFLGFVGLLGALIAIAAPIFEMAGQYREHGSAPAMMFGLVVASVFGAPAVALVGSLRDYRRHERNST